MVRVGRNLVFVVLVGLFGLKLIVEGARPRGSRHMEDDYEERVENVNEALDQAAKEIAEEKARAEGRLGEEDELDPSQIIEELMKSGFDNIDGGDDRARKHPEEELADLWLPSVSPGRFLKKIKFHSEALVLLSGKASVCGGCEDVEDYVNEIYEDMKASFDMFKVDVTAEFGPELLERLTGSKETELPVLLRWTHGVVREYTGPQYPDAMVDYLTSVMDYRTGAVKSVEQAKELMALEGARGPRVFAFLPRGDISGVTKGGNPNSLADLPVAAQRTLRAAAQVLSPSLELYVAVDEDVAEALGFKPPFEKNGIRVWKPRDAVVTGPPSSAWKDVEELSSWIEGSLGETVTGVDAFSLPRAFSDDAEPFVLAVLKDPLGYYDDTCEDGGTMDDPPPEQSLRLKAGVPVDDLKFVHDLARKMAEQGSKVKWYWTDVGWYPGVTAGLDVTAAELPTASLFDSKSGRDFLFKEFEGNEWSEAGLSRWVNAFESGQLTQRVRSAPIPAENPGPVIQLVADEWDRWVSKQGAKDVLVTFCVPWSPECVNVAPVIMSLGETFAEIKSVEVAAMDLADNDLPPESLLNLKRDFGSLPVHVIWPAIRGPDGALDGPRSPIVFDGKDALDLQAVFHWVLANTRSAYGKRSLELNTEAYEMWKMWQ